jgi:phenylacetate-coenzyme A ligase PaaK-like adenylate-forming protein
MRYTKKLFHLKDIYNTETYEDFFVKAMRENALFQYQNCEDYRRVCENFGFDPETIHSFDDLVRLPFLPTLYFKHHNLCSVPDKKLLIKATSSGTSGSMSHIGFDFKSLNLGKSMVIRVGKYHRLWSPKPVNYIIFGYQPTKENKTAVSKTAFGFTFFAPALSRTFALESTKNGYALSWDKVLGALEKCAKSKFPMRTIGFPAYTYFLLRDIKERGIRYKMPKGSMLTIGGGWKQFYAEKVDKADFYALVKDVLDIDEEHIVEFFGAVEHPVLYTDCKFHHFHIPVYSRVIIRNPDDFSPVKDGEPGLINLLSPMMQSAPLLSVMTDDLGVLHREKCPCGAPSPWLEIIGRVGISDIVTCAAGAGDYLKE